VSESLGGVGYMGGPCSYRAMSKLIIFKSMVDIILCLCVEYTHSTLVLFICSFAPMLEGKNNPEKLF